MRKLILATVALIPLGLGACASSPTRGHNSSEREIDRLQRECTARGGILVPSGRLTGREPLDNVCKISGGASLIEPPPGAR